MTKNNNGILLGAALIGAALLVSKGKTIVEAKEKEAVKKASFTSNTQFVKTLMPYAQAAEKITQVPWIVSITIAAVESGWGKHAPGNNFYGIKADKSWKGEVTKLKTPECVPNEAAAHKLNAELISVIPAHGSGAFTACTTKGNYTAWINDKFRAYSSPAGSVLDFATFLTKNSRYKPAFAFINDPKQFATYVLTHGYSTAQYVNTFLTIMEYVKKEAAK